MSQLRQICDSLIFPYLSSNLGHFCLYLQPLLVEISTKDYLYKTLVASRRSPAGGDAFNVQTVQQQVSKLIMQVISTFSFMLW